MSMFNKFAVMIAFAVCTTNAWAGSCKLQQVKLNNDKYYIYVDGADNNKLAFVCGGGEYDCSNGTKLYIDKRVTDMYIAHRNKKEVAYIVECSDKLIDSKWVNKTDVGIGSLKKCSYDQWKEWEWGHSVRLNSGDLVFCKETYGLFSCVSMNNEDVCYLDDHTHQEFKQQKAAEEEAKNSENKASETKTDCGNVGQRECDGDYKFYVCKTNADCGSDHLPSHATAGHCVSAGRSGYKVCTATDCGENYELARDKNDNSMGWCRKKSADKNEKSDTDENSGGGQGNIAESNNGESGATLTTVFDDLDKFISEKFVGSSVWKNDEGNFNTARLVSDSVAGVVLGTVGGVITSHIIKKNQIKNGFDDLKCTIGGQTVASYGDEFRVGVK